MTQELSSAAAPDIALEREVAAMIVNALNLEVKPEEIGLDSIDILEVALVVSKRFGFQLKADSEDNFRIFASLRSLSEYIAANRVK